MFENECATCTFVGREWAIILESDVKETAETGISAPDTEKPKTEQRFPACKDAL